MTFSQIATLAVWLAVPIVFFYYRAQSLKEQKASEKSERRQA